VIIDGIFFVVIIVLFARSLRVAPARGKGSGGMPIKPANPQLTHLLEYADNLFRTKKYLVSEKAYLKVLKIDHRNVTAYTRLGMIYHIQKNYDDAIECFALAAQIAPSAPAHQRLSLVLVENGNYIKAISAMEKAIMFEPTPLRYIGLAKIYQRLANNAKATTALERAVQIEPTKQGLQLLAEAYVQSKNRSAAQKTYQQLLEIEPNDKKANHWLSQPH
jgi:tetratricopeptide (TPR) repeat protein